MTATLESAETDTPNEVALTYRMRQIIAYMLASEPRTKHYSSGIAAALGIKTGTISPLMHRMVDAGWLTIDPGGRYDGGGTARVYYKFTTGSRAMLRKAIKE